MTVAEAELFLRVAGELPAYISRRYQAELEFRLDDASWATAYAADPEPGIDNSGKPMLAATSRHIVPDEWLRVLAGIELGQWPGGFVPHTLNQFLFDHYPAALQSFCLTETTKLRRRAQEAFGLIRWRYSADVKRGALLPLGEVTWSGDCQSWQRLRLRWTVEAHLAPQLTLMPSVAQALEGLALADTREPIGREIWHVAANADPRTAVVLAVTAVEVELKRLVSAVVPEAEWLITNLPAPPIVRIIEEYLPLISRTPGRPAPPKKLLQVLRKGVKLRNDSVHVGPGAASSWLSPGGVSAETVKEVMAAASDLLWLFDWYRGHDWAVEQLSDDTKAALGLPVEPAEETAPRTFRVPPDPPLT